MFENIPVKVDSVGRMVIPKNIRKMYNIEKDSLLFLLLEGDRVVFIKDESKQKLDNLLDKVKRLEKYNLDFIVMKNEKCLYKTNNNHCIPDEVITNILNSGNDLGSVSMTINNMRNTYYCFQGVDKYTKFLIFIYSDDEKLKDKIHTICNLFCE